MLNTGQVKLKTFIHTIFFWGGGDLSLEEFGQLVHISSSYDQKLSCFRDTVHVPESCLSSRNNLFKYIAFSAFSRLLFGAFDGEVARSYLLCIVSYI